MNSTRVLALVSTLFLLISCQREKVVYTYGVTPFTAIMANLSQYDGQRIVTRTYASLAFEGQAAYLNENDEANLLFINSLWLDLPESMDPELLHKRGVFDIEGIIDLSHHGHLGLWIGAIKVTRIEEYLIFEDSSG